MASSIPLPSRTLFRRCHTPTVIQLEAAECGAAALCMIVRYYGSQVSLEEVRELCGTNRDGVNAYNILRAAENYGLKTEGFRCELEELYKAQLPLIAYWNFNHFVVIEGFGKKHVYINDPATGPRTISYDELNRSFTGVILTLEPTAEFKRVSARDTVWANLRQRLKLFRWPVVFSILGGLMAIVPALMLIALSQFFIDEILLARIPSWQFGFIAAFLVMIIVSTAIQYLQSRAVVNFSIQLSTLLSSQFIWRILHLPLLFFMQRFGGEIASRMSLNQSVSDTFVGPVLTTFVSLIFAFIFALVMLYYDLQITLIAALIVAVNLLTMIYLYRSRANAYADYRQIQGLLSSFTLNGLENIESLKAVGGEYQFLARYGGLYTRSLKATQNMAKVDIILGTLVPFFSSLGYLIVLILGSLRIIQGYLTVGEFFALQMLFKNFTDPVLSIANLNQTLQLLTINTSRLNDVLLHPEDPLLQKAGTQDGDLKAIFINSSQDSAERGKAKSKPSGLSEEGMADAMTDEEDRSGKAAAGLSPDEWIKVADLKHGHFKGVLEVKNLSFGYQRFDAPLLQAINLKILPGSFIALVGPSGCGKSTLIKVIGGLLQAWEGEILVDGIPYNDYPHGYLARSIAFVEQNPALIQDSIASNLNLLDPFIPHATLVQAARDACIHDEIMLRPGGYGSLVDKQGINFSGGQRQRLELACALARRPSLIILDEATSAVDAIREKQILQNIRARGCACFIITHRLSSIISCDQILVMNQGRIIQSGNHHELMQQSGLYRDFVEAEKQRGVS